MPTIVVRHHRRAIAQRPSRAVDAYKLLGVGRQNEIATWIRRPHARDRGSFLLLAGRSHVFREPARNANFSGQSHVAHDGHGRAKGDLKRTPEEAFLDA